MLKSDMKLEDIIQQYRSKYSIKKKIKINIKNTLKILPSNIYSNLKFVVHKVRK